MKPVAQPDLPALADPRPRELLVSGPDLAQTLDRLKAQGATVEALETLPRQNACWRVRVHWPASGLW